MRGAAKGEVELMSSCPDGLCSLLINDQKNRNTNTIKQGDNSDGCLCRSRLLSVRAGYTSNGRQNFSTTFTPLGGMFSGLAGGSYGPLITFNLLFHGETCDVCPARPKWRLNTQKVCIAAGNACKAKRLLFHLRFIQLNLPDWFTTFWMCG